MEDTVRGCCWGAARLLADVGIEADPNADVEPVYQRHRREITSRAGVDYIALAALVVLGLDDEPRLF